MNPITSGAAIALVLLVTTLISFFGLRISRTTSDFFVASRTVRPWWNASAISGEYVSVGTFLGLSGLVLVSGSDAFWFPIGYSAGYLLMLALVAAPLRRSGAYTIPDFIEARLDSVVLRRITSLVVVAIGWLYIVPQLHGAALAVGVVAGLPAWVGSTLVAVVVGGAVAAGGMRAITYVQGAHYWLKLIALAVPVVFFLVVLIGDGTTIDPVVTFPLQDGPAGQDVYHTVSLMLGLVLGTMGLPHVLVRLYTSPDGIAARRTIVLVIVLIGVFYMLSSTMALIARATAPDLAAPGLADTVVLVMPSRFFAGTTGELLTALVVAGAFAAFLATSAGLVVSLAGVISQDVLGGGIRSFRIAAVASVVIPLVVTFFGTPGDLASSVGMVFVFAASTISPVVVLAVWWRGLTARGALAGTVVGALACGGAFGVDSMDLVGHPVLQGLLAQPAAWTVPLSVVTTVVVSLTDPRGAPSRTDRYLIRLHAPER